jgi:hypothetical protein
MLGRPWQRRRAWSRWLSQAGETTAYWLGKADSKIPFKNRYLRGLCLCILLFPWSAALMIAGAQWSMVSTREPRHKHHHGYDAACFAWRETAFCHPFG